MNKSLFISLNSGKFIELEDFEYLTYPTNMGGVIKVTNLTEFYLYDREITFVCKNSTLTLKSEYIEYIKLSDYTK